METVDTKTGSLKEVSPLDRVAQYSWEEFLDHVRAFHGHIAPGVIIGGVMFSIARDRLPEETLFDSICETVACLPDAVQILSPCTVGNGWLKIVNLGRYALVLCDKYTGNGIRVYLDQSKLQDWNEIRNWFLKLKPKREQDGERLLEQIREAGTGIYTIHPIQVKDEYLTKRSKGPIGICSVCGEAYPVKDGAICLGCQGEAPY